MSAKMHLGASRLIRLLAGRGNSDIGAPTPQVPAIACDTALRAWRPAPLRSARSRCPSLATSAADYLATWVGHGSVPVK